MITQRVLTSRELDELYNWVDGIKLSRTKKNISRDFSDATLMAEMIHIFFPSFIELHNYPSTNAGKSKMENWKTLNSKVLSKFGMYLVDEDCRKLSASTPLAIEPLLFEFKHIVEETKIKQEEYDAPRASSNEDVQETSDVKQKKESKVQQLHEILALLKEKIALVQRSIEKKDSHIRDLQEILRMHTS